MNMENTWNKTPLFTIQFLKDGADINSGDWGDKIQCYKEDAYVQPKTPIDFMNEYKSNVDAG